VAKTRYDLPSLRTTMRSAQGANMDKLQQRIRTWLTLDVTIVTFSLITIAAAAWIGFIGFALP
jgi:hypothetical protein